MEEKTKHEPGKSKLPPIYKITVIGLIVLVLLGLITFFIILIIPKINLLRNPQAGCNGPSLQIGSIIYKVKIKNMDLDQPISIPQSSSRVAYWLNGTETNVVFGLSPTADNITALSDIQAGQEAVFSTKECTVTTFVLEEPVNTVPEDMVLIDQSVNKLTIFIQPGSTTPGWYVTGNLQAVTINNPAEPPSNPDEVQAEISLLDKKTTEDGKNILVTLSITNFGKSALTMKPEDVIIQAGNVVLPMISTQPVLPVDIPAGGMATIEITIPQPGVNNATLSIFSLEFDLGE